jgi:hypothetical protein
MKLLGKIFLIIAGICFLANGVWSVVAVIKAGAPSGDGNFWFGYVVTWLAIVVQIFGGLGAIFYAIGVGPFRGWVGPIAIVLLVLWIVGLVSDSITFAQDPVPSNVWPAFQSSIIVAPIEALYVIGYLFARKK